MSEIGRLLRGFAAQQNALAPEKGGGADLVPHRAQFYYAIAGIQRGASVVSVVVVLVLTGGGGGGGATVCVVVRVSCATPLPFWYVVCLESIRLPCASTASCVCVLLNVPETGAAGSGAVVLRGGGAVGCGLRHGHARSQGQCRHGGEQSGSHKRSPLN